MKANIIIINSINCNISYEGFLRKGMICAGQPEGGRDSCQVCLKQEIILFVIY